MVMADGLATGGWGHHEGWLPVLPAQTLAARKIGRRLITQLVHRRFSAKSITITPITIVMIPGPGMPGTDMMRPSTTSVAPKRFLRKTTVHRMMG
jgi:hypothetical protein